MAQSPLGIPCSYSRNDVDWRGVTDPKRRRKMQNRLNQRSRRERIREEKSSTLSLIRDTSENRTVSTCLTTRQTIDLEQLAYQKYLGSPTSDFLLTLIQFNVFRALLGNMTTLGLSASWLEDEAVSEITTNTSSGNALIPSSLQPTTLQRQTIHHPWLDLFPFPALRDNILRACNLLEMEDEDELCSAMVGWCNSPGTRTGLIIWGEPWDPKGWEATEGFVRAFGWTVDGCPELLQATNYWRSVRGEEPLDFPGWSHAGG